MSAVVRRSRSRASATRRISASALLAIGASSSGSGPTPSSSGSFSTSTPPSASARRRVGSSPLRTARRVTPASIAITSANARTTCRRTARWVARRGPVLRATVITTDAASGRPGPSSGYTWCTSTSRVAKRPARPSGRGADQHRTSGPRRVGDLERPPLERVGTLDEPALGERELEVRRVLADVVLRHELVGELERKLVGGLKEDRGQGLDPVVEVDVELAVQRARDDRVDDQSCEREDCRGAEEDAREQVALHRPHPAALPGSSSST